MDPHLFFVDPDPADFLNADRDPDPGGNNTGKKINKDETAL